MLTQRAAQQLLRPAAHRPAYRLAAIATSNRFPLQRRHVAAQAVSAEAANSEILAQQRLHRPVSPHLGIYQPQITWYLSILNRITGCVLSGGFYVFGTAYLAAPTLGWQLGSASLAAGFAAWPLALQFASKLLVAWPFAFHAFNGVRHLIWDTASMIRNQQVNRSGWAVLALSTAAALGLALI